jgi:molybdenum cofactor biosynthesis enzyme MoaA
MPDDGTRQGDVTEGRLAFKQSLGGATSPGADPRSVIDAEMQAEIDAQIDSKDLTKEAAVKHSRHWVRLTRLCNQRCLFCLDAWNHNGTYIDTAQLLQYIALGKQLGRERLILSGGEPTIHPDYVKFIRHGRKVGYDWIQTVTNGMMFAYPEFTRKVLNAGLDEVTMSIHGHTARIQDRLTGVKGAFDQAIQGIRNIRALSGGRTVINIDVVINKQNIRHLRDIIDLFRGMDIHEFDLLYMVPFGRGFAEYRKQLYFNLDDHVEDLQRALEVSREPGVFIWTNRLPPQALEGFEELIQAPHKLHSEVQGGLHNFEGFMKLGVAPDCHGERCDFCFLKGLCHDEMFAYRDRLTSGTFDRVRLDLNQEVAGEVAAERLDGQRPGVLHVQGGTADEVGAYLADHPYGDVTGMEITAEIHGDDGVETLVGRDDVSRVAVTTVAGLSAASSALASRLSDGEEPDALHPIEVRLDAEVAAAMLGEGDHRDLIEAGLLIGRLPTFEYLSECKENGTTPELLADLRAAGVRLMNVAPCLGGENAEAGPHYELSRDMIDEKGHMMVSPYVQRYIVGEYYKKSVRCRDCALNDSCRGMHIQFLRAHGFAILEPIPGEAAAALPSEPLQIEAA